MFTFFSKKFRHPKRGFLKNPSFYFSLALVILFGFLFFGSASLADMNYSNSKDTFFNGFFKNSSNLESNNLFVGQNNKLALETPDLKILQDDFIYGISTPHIVNTQTLGSIFGSSAQNNKDVTDYIVQPGDTSESIAQNFNISLNTLLWANNISKKSQLKAGQSLIVLPVSGLIHIVKSGDTISGIAKIYKAKVEDIILFNELLNEGDIFIGDILIIPGGVMPEKALRSNGQTALPDSFFIYPIEGQISQGIHYYNAVDIANKCGTPVYAAASGTIQRVASGGKWNFGMGNYITILHSNGVTTYYGHLMSLFVKPGDKVSVGDRIGLVGRTGQATGCHVHFQVLGATNPLARYFVGTYLRYK
ncbi:MAG: hypothetical protein A3C58_01970 [Candidatus Staskawiczbacteria bacterium RIFCSPHIGHO2_02_FULL_34_10]|uniref:LysM domain-containing protein n=1 Tax=Candidatus Staskawiczbacteria bacterium RIFCSPHIGHO2_02_FULL_34_10 TaxID=1802205 RepID=A0A1G2HZ75_9BACT|nr:MAG: hypothetical protein A3C58_01970 [Candidatus Staskawiczbacteria bacterium RIFCSPHIGHO2_02_FULL_34_10]